MRAPSGHMTAPAVQAVLTDGALVGDWVLDQRKSSIRLKNKSMWGLVRVNGVFREVSGNGTVSPDGQVSGTVTVAAASIDTKNARRDTHLRSADFFDSGNNPDITFTANGIRPLSFEAAASVQGDVEIWLDAEVPINRADFGLTWNLMGMISMTNTLTIHAVFTRR